MTRWIAAYDIADDRRRDRVARLLQGYGTRVQASVFELLLDTDDLDRLERRVRRAIDPQTDRVRLYPVCAACAAKVLDWGAEAGVPFDAPTVFLA